MNFFVLACLLALPTFAVWRLGTAYHWPGVYALLLSSITFWVYAVDKRRAEQGAWRVSEAQLHLLELLGGSGREHFWPNADCGTNVPKAVSCLCSG
ncbi:MAG: DUF1294 domain-containing protein [Verrucomicrobiota bacterium]